MTAEPLLTARDVTKRVRDGSGWVTLIGRVSLEVAEGERVALVGPSGSGKSTLLHVLGALDPQYEGSVCIAGQPLEALDDASLAAFRNRTLGFVFQAYNLLGHLNVRDNVTLPARFSGPTASRQDADVLLERVGMAGKAHRKPRTLSGGERQRVAIARAIYQHPRLVLCDEPTGNLDRDTARDVLALFNRLTEEGVALLVATHDEAIAGSADRVLQLRAGALT